MSDIAINALGVGKKYKIGAKKAGSFRESFSNIFSNRNTKSTSEEFWALQDLNFEIKKGEAIGIIGKNGAGKSTLLKILSQITGPTTGRIEINGRLASLLEVGTGFHPELTGRENIFLNGTILGMNRKEIRSKMDEIIAFSGVEKFIDTPVKHYSSGMYVRLAFAVAAHLEPEILIVDEVLAVGDAEFQKKCLGKMEDVAGEGRTVIFVSHNMGAIKALCGSGMLLSEGKIVLKSDINCIIDRYQNLSVGRSFSREKIKPVQGRGQGCYLEVVGNREIEAFCGDSVAFSVNFISNEAKKNVGFSFLIRSAGSPVVGSASFSQGKHTNGSSNRWMLKVNLGNIPLNEAIYTVDIYVTEGEYELAKFSEVFILNINPFDVFGAGKTFPGSVHWGNFYWDSLWDIKPI